MTPCAGRHTLRGVCASIVLTALLFALEAGATAVAVRNQKQLRSAFVDGSVKTIQLAESVVLTHEWWTPLPVVEVRRNVTVESSPSLPLMASIFWNGIYAKLRLANGVTLRFHRVVMRAVRGPSDTFPNSPGPSILAVTPPGPPAWAVLENCVYVWWRTTEQAWYVTPARNEAFTALRPALLPGTHSTLLTYAGPAPLCSLPLYRGEQPTCWDHSQVSFFVLDLALWGKSKPDNSTAIGNAAYVNGNWVFQIFNTVSVGEVVASKTCLETLGVENCLQTLKVPLEKIPRPPPPPPVRSPSPAAEKRRMLSIVLPCVLGGAAVLALVALAVLVRRRRLSSSPGAKYAAGSDARHDEESSIARSCDAATGASQQRCPAERMGTPTPASAAAAGHVSAASKASAAHQSLPSKLSLDAASGSSAGALLLPPRQHPQQHQLQHRQHAALLESECESVLSLVRGRLTSMPSAVVASVPAEAGACRRRSHNMPAIGPASKDASASDSLYSSSTCPRVHVSTQLRLGEDVQVEEGATLGLGYHGQVLRGTYAGAPAAVKFLHPQLLLGGEGQRATASAAPRSHLTSLDSELQALLRCRHANVVRLLGAGLSPPNPFLVLELCPRGSLQELLYPGGLPEEGTDAAAAGGAGPGAALSSATRSSGAVLPPLPLEVVVLLARDIAQGLAYLHMLDPATIIHRDLKPSNVLIDANGVAKLADFGIARMSAQTLVTDNPEAGTCPYLAPELLNPDNYRVTEKVDIYAFGVLVREMLARRPPWQGMHRLQMAMAVVMKNERPLDFLRAAPPTDAAAAGMSQLGHLHAHGGERAPPVGAELAPGDAALPDQAADAGCTPVVPTLPARAPASQVLHPNVLSEEAASASEPRPSSTAKVPPVRLLKLLTACLDRDPAARPAAVEVVKVLTLILKALVVG